MKLASVIRVFSALCFAITATVAVSLSKPNCQEKCGNVVIPYPFGIGIECSANSSFTVICQNSTFPPKPLLSSINLEVVNISLYGTVIVKLHVSPINCSDGLRIESLPISLKGGPFFISSHYNSFVVMGCNLLVLSTIGGCKAVCNANSTNITCNGVNCCHAAFPTRFQELQYTYKSIQEANNSSFCGYVFPADKRWLQNEDYKRYKGLVSDMSNPFDSEFGFAPLVLEWEYDAKNISYTACSNPDDYLPKHTQFENNPYFQQGCINYPENNPYCWNLVCIRDPEDYHCNLMVNYDNEYRYSSYYASVNDYASISSIKYCSCHDGYVGNPYIDEGCSDIDECDTIAPPNGFEYCSGYTPCETYDNASIHYSPICPGMTCINEIGSYTCEYAHGTIGFYDDRNDGFRVMMKITSIVIGSVVGGLILLNAVWKFGKAITDSVMAIKASRKYMFFKRNGGILLEQQMAAIENGLDKIRLFSSIELAKATDDYNENRILGRGGEGVVYKGMLEDGRIVAVKKSETVNQGDVESFINEVVIVSQINHRNVVKLLGCCLESEVPRLVYEFVPNGTLFHHIHDPHEDFPLFWELRVRIAKQVAGALAYLHSAASVPIYHRDIKSTNILLDDKYRAKISDFGTSRSVCIDQTHVTTRVVGTFGYLDPEYFQSNQFTEKSDVYSFGVVLVELLTGEKAISAARVEEGRGLAMHFLHSMEENQLFDIVDERVLREGKREEIEAMAEIGRKCLHLNGKGRPTMKEVARDLDAIQVETQESDFLQNEIGCSSIDDVESDFSSISEIIEVHEP